MSEIFGQTASYEDSKIALLGVPWEVTVSHSSGTVHGPQWIQQASSQLDFFDPKFQHNPSQQGIHFRHLKFPQQNHLRLLASQIIEIKKNQPPINLQTVNKGCYEMVEIVQRHTKKILDDQKIFGLIGGDHSVSEGALLEIGRRYESDFGLLHFDAHADMRKAYQGFKHSHASVMYNVLQQPYTPQTFVQVGVRDLCEEEFQRISDHNHVHCFFDHDIKKRLFEGESWKSITQDILEKLPSRVYVSLDVDALTWNYAPHTGCPVPGGLSYDQIVFLLEQLKEQNKKIIGFDVVEVAKPTTSHLGEWDGNVGARLVYKLCGLSLF